MITNNNIIEILKLKQTIEERLLVSKLSILELKDLVDEIPFPIKIKKKIIKRAIEKGKVCL